MKRTLLMLLTLVFLFVMVMPAIAVAQTSDVVATGTITWGDLVPLGFVVLAVVDALKKEFKDVTGHDLSRLWVITASFLTGSCAAMLSVYWAVLPFWIRVILGGGALGLTVSGVVKLGDYVTGSIAKARSAPQA